MSQDRITADWSEGGGLGEIEQRVLSALLSGDDPLRKRARELLERYQWSEDAHQAVFDILMSLPPAGREVVRDQFPSRLTRRGFPDFDFNRLLGYPPVDAAQVEEWMIRLSRRG